MESMKNPPVEEVTTTTSRPPARVRTDAPVVGNDGFGTTIPTGATMLDDIFDGTASLSGIKGSYTTNSEGYATGNFAEDPTGRNFLQYNDASGNAPAGFNNMANKYSPTNKNPFQSVTSKEKEMNTDFIGNKTSKMNDFIRDLAHKKGINPHGKEYANFASTVTKDFNQLLDARTAYDKNYNFQSHLGTVGGQTDASGNPITSGGDIPGTYTFGGVGTRGYDARTDLQALDVAQGGDGTPYTRINNNLISRQGRYVDANKGVGPENLVWERSGTVGDTDASLADNPYQAFYWDNPELGKRGLVNPATGVMTTTKGRSYGKSNVETLDESNKDALGRNIQHNQRQQFYNSNLASTFRDNYGDDIMYDYDNVDAPWKTKNNGEISGNFSFYKR